MLVEQKFCRKLGKEERLSRLNWRADKRYSRDIIFPYLGERKYSVHNLTISLKISEQQTRASSSSAVDFHGSSDFK